MADINTCTGNGLTRAVKALLRNAFPTANFTISMQRYSERITWTDDGPTVEQVQDTLIAAGAIARSGPGRASVPGR